MLSVINRGSESGGITCKVYEDYAVYSHVKNLVGISAPLVVDPGITILQGRTKEEVYKKLVGVTLLNVDVAPTVKNGYTRKTVNPKEV